MPSTRAKKPSLRKTAFVPRSVLTGIFVGSGVIPLCVAACGGKTGGGGTTLTVAMVMADGGDAMQYGVACNCFDGAPGVAVIGFDGGPDVIFTVAMVGFDASDAADAPADVKLRDAPDDVRDTGFSVADTGFGVADTGFGGG